MSPEVVETYMACCYCGDPETSKEVCCGEIHFEEVYVLESGEVLTESEYLELP